MEKVDIILKPIKLQPINLNKSKYMTILDDKMT